MLKYLDYYRAHLESLKKSPHTIKQYCIDTEQFLNYIQKNNLKLKEELDSVLIGYKQFLETEYTQISSFNRKVSSLKNFLSFLQERNIIDTVPNDALKQNKLEKKNIHPLTQTRLNLVLSVYLNKYRRISDQEFGWIALRNFCAVRVIAELGLKPIEVVEMKWTHIHNNEIKVIRSKSVRTLSLSKSLIDWLELYKNETKMIFPLCEQVDYMWLGIGNKKYQPITEKTIERIFQTISKEVGFKVTATALRYSKIQNELDEKVDEQLNLLYTQLGYARKGVLLERVERFRHES